MFISTFLTILVNLDKPFASKPVCSRPPAKQLHLGDHAFRQPRTQHQAQIPSHDILDLIQRMEVQCTVARYRFHRHQCDLPHAFRAATRVYPHEGIETQVREHGRDVGGGEVDDVPVEVEVYGLRVGAMPGDVVRADDIDDLDVTDVLAHRVEKVRLVEDGEVCQKETPERVRADELRLVSGRAEQLKFLRR